MTDEELLIWLRVEDTNLTDFAADRIEELLAERKKAVEALGLADDALYEAEAILGGEYGDQYGPLCETMIKLRATLAEISSHNKGESHDPL